VKGSKEPAGLGDGVLNALVDVVSAVNAGVSAGTPREGFRMADAAARSCGDVCSPSQGSPRSDVYRVETQSFHPERRLSMNSLTRRGALGLGAVSASAFLSATARGAGKAAGDEGPVQFKIKDVTLEKVEQDHRTINVHFGKPSRPTKVVALPLGENIGILVSHVFPGSVNNIPFDWDRLKGLVGERVSMVIVAEDDGLSVHTIATAND
jgi:hypothetical protein